MAALIYNTVRTPDGRPINSKVEIRLIAGATYSEPGYLRDDQITILSTWASQTGDDGYWAVELEPNDLIDPEGTYYEVIERYPPGNRTTKYYIRFNDAATPSYWVGDVLIHDPEAIVSNIRASDVSFVPGGTIISNNVQDALIELSQQITAGTGDAHYVHNQGSPSATWTIVHNLGKRPSVTVVDSGDTEVEGDIHYVDNNTVTVLFSSGFSGKAYLN
jgi:hypothetical protein